MLVSQGSMGPCQAVGLELGWQAFLCTPRSRERTYTQHLHEGNAQRIGQAQERHQGAEIASSAARVSSPARVQCLLAGAAPQASDDDVEMGVSRWSEGAVENTEF
jgi:hypothetical protein